MKKVKNYIVIISFTYMIIILFLLVNVFINKKPFVILTTPQSVKDDYNVLKMEIDTIDDPVCKSAISDLLAEYTINNFNGKVKMNDIYKLTGTKNVVDDYDKINKKCNLSGTKLDKYDISNRYLSMMALREKIVESYFYQYELRFTDETSASYYDGLSQVAYNALKYEEVELIQNYIDMIGES